MARPRSAGADLEPGADLLRAKDLVIRHGWNATAYQILNPGMRLWFSRRREAVIGYAEWVGVRVVAGAPVCSEADLPAVAAEFEAETSGFGLRVCYFAAGPRLEGVLGGRIGYSQVQIGSQPVWRPADWQGVLAGRASLRAQLARARNKGLTVREIPAEAAARSPELKLCLREWLAGHGLPTLHFLVEPMILERLWDRRIFIAEKAGKALGFLVATPVHARNGWLIEEVIRGRNAPNGMAESLVDAAFRAAAAGGVEYFTLGLAPLARIPAESSRLHPAWLNLAFKWALLHGSRFYNFKGLHWFKAKLGPGEWEPIFAICTGAFSPRILLAIAAAFGGMGPLRFLLKTLALSLRVELGRMLRLGFGPALRVFKAPRPGRRA